VLFLDGFATDGQQSVGVPPRDAMAILGHSHYSITMEIYTDSGEVLTATPWTSSAAS
jgi:hypothetical protein